MSDYSLPHQINILLHIISGSLALILAIIAMSSQKGKRIHKKSGVIFLICMSIVIITGVIGVFVFKANGFLLSLTLLSGYQAFSGYRILSNKSSIPKPLDIVIAILTLLSGVYYILYFKSIGFFWEPGLIYGTIGALFAIVIYDFLRYLIPRNKFKNRWLYEHIYKMIAAFTALLAAFFGTVFPQYHPYSQFLPSLFGTVLAIIFILYYWSKNKTKNRRF
ncbi:hypothetical protein [uncultured Maribacter sp.]|uniref:hypothetical protein n=1 Tax=uncultured Maribacter sp. TaxID=431308 RepID=UPI0030EC3AAC|tara:strand:- start:49887 stop:50546 length:660 start_codon:yes stop_codon:yes gene_type:complete